MEQSFGEYLSKIGMSETLSGRIDRRLEEYTWAMAEEIRDIFVVNYFKKDEGSQFESLWLFSNTYCMELKNFATQDSFDCIKFQGNVEYFEIDKEDYDFETASTTSRLEIKIQFKSQQSAIFKASGENCDQLLHIFRTYFLPNFQGQ